MHPLYDAEHVTYVTVRITRGCLPAHRCTCAGLRFTTFQYRMIFILLSVPLWHDLADTVFDGVRLEGFKSMANVFFNSLSCSLVSYCFPFLFITHISVLSRQRVAQLSLQGGGVALHAKYQVTWAVTSRPLCHIRAGLCNRMGQAYPELIAKYHVN